MLDAPFRYCLNTGTLRGQRLDLPTLVDVAARCGYSGIEPWIEEIERYRSAGGSLPELKARIADSGLTVESAIGFTEWAVDSPTRRAAGLEQARRDMDLVAQVGGKRIAAPPAGAIDQPDIPLPALAERYRALCDVGAGSGVTPMVEVWGFSRCLCRLGEALYVAAESGSGDACVLADVYHLYKGGSPSRALRTVAGTAMHVFHMNDYPADPPRETISDSDRVFPGLGVAPLTSILQDLETVGFRGALSLELFNETYWQQEAETVARTGLARMRSAVSRAMERSE